MLTQTLSSTSVRHPAVSQQTPQNAPRMRRAAGGRIDHLI
jgi:hypothetical protein